MPTVRVKLDPLPLPSVGAGSGVSGVLLSLVRRGPGSTKAERETAQSAQLKFKVRLLPSPRSDREPEEQDLAELNGELSIDASNGKPVFALDKDPESVLRDLATPGADEERRALRVELNPAHFIGAEAVAPLRLFLPGVEVGEFSHFEVEAALSVAGSEEAAFGASDTLDVPVLPRPCFTFELVDELGEPLSGVPLEMTVLGLTRAATTDHAGFARIDDLAAEAMVVRFLDPAALQQMLLGRWKSARSGAYVHVAEGVVVLPLTGLEQQVLVQSQRRLRVSIQPRVVQARVTGGMFDINKSFLLPAAIPSLRALAQLYEENPGAKLLLVGHTDTSGDAAFNDKLSLERSESVAAYLRDDVDAWIHRYAKSIALEQRWGGAEDLLMLSALTPGVGAAALDSQAVLAFQQSHNALPAARQSDSHQSVPENGELDEATRRQLIADYMNQDGTSLPSDVEVVVHGCGEHFPLAGDTGELDSDPADDREEAEDRRVELFFFEPDFGIQPPPPAKNSKRDSREYPEWRRRARETFIFDVNAHGPLSVAAFAPESSTLEFFIEPPEGESLAVLRREQGRVENDSVTFDVMPELLPASVQFRVVRDGREDHRSGFLNPLELRDALFRGDTDTAIVQLTSETQPNARAASGAAGAPRQSLAPSGGAPAPNDPNQKPLLFVFHWANAGHRFLKAMSFTLRALSGSVANQPLAEATGSKLGLKTFVIPSDVDSVRLELDVPSPRTTQPILTLRQELQILRAQGRAPSLFAKKSNISGLDLHPRVESLAYQSGDPRKVVIAVQLDLLFLDVTDHVRALGTFPGTFATFEASKQRNGSLSQIRILEHTGGRPVTWPVILPPGLPGSEAATNVLLFFKNEALDRVSAGAIVSGAYSDSDDANYTRALTGYWLNPTNPAKYVGSDGTASYRNYPLFGWDKQLRQANKPVVVLFPIPHSVDFGALERPGASSKALIESALRALFAERQLATGQSFAPHLKRLALGAWSSGTDTLYKWVSTRKELAFVDEIYAFDGKGPYPVSFDDWFRVDPDRRRLCLIGSAYTEVPANQVKQRLSHPNVFIQPGDPSYWYKNAGYHASLSLPGASAPLRFRQSPSQPQLAADASAPTNLFVQGETLSANAVSAQRSITLFSPSIGKRTIANVGHEEAAVFAVLEALGSQSPGAPPIADLAEFQRVTSWIDSQPGASEPVRSFRHRHSWSVIGGLFGDRGRPFVGYFQACLERSGF